METIVLSLKGKPRISRHACWLICFLAEALPNYQDTPLNSVLKVIIDALFTNASRSDIPTSHLNVIDVSFMAILNLIHYAPTNELAAIYLKQFIASFK